MYEELVDTFQGRPSLDFDDSDNWQGPEFAYRLREEYDDELSLADRLSNLLQQPDVNQLKALIIGAWSGSCEGGDSTSAVELLVQSAAQLPELEHLFFGEMTYEECEISWINQSDLAPLLRAFPKLRSLRVRGGTGLSFSKVRHDHLRELAVETGGLPRSVIREIGLCEFPALERLELLLGEENYGFDGNVEDLQPLLSGGLFPRLKHLGLMNSMIANEIAEAVAHSPIVSRLESLDLSLGNLDGEGMRSLQGLAAYPNLKSLNVSHHYATEDDVYQLKQALNCQVMADDQQEPDDEWRPIVHAE